VSFNSILTRLSLLIAASILFSVSPAATMLPARSGPERSARDQTLMTTSSATDGVAMVDVKTTPSVTASANFQFMRLPPYGCAWATSSRVEIKLFRGALGSVFPAQRGRRFRFAARPTAHDAHRQCDAELRAYWCKWHPARVLPGRV